MQSKPLGITKKHILLRNKRERGEKRGKEREG